MALVPLTRKSEVAAAYAALVRQIRRGALVRERTIGWRGGSGTFKLYWQAKHGFWTVFSIGDHGEYWMPYGSRDPDTFETASISCEINPPPHGIDRRKGGIFLSDAAGRHYLAHTGKLAGGRKGIGREAFLASSGWQLRPVEWPDGITTEAAVLGRIGSPALLREIGTYIAAVDEFKLNVTTAAPAPVQNKNKNKELSYTPEFEGSRKSYRVSRVIESECSHGTVVRCLREQLARIGCRAYSTGKIDLFLTDQNGEATHVFEVKTNQDTSNIYGAVGQLLMHTALSKPAPKRIAVLPGKPNAETEAAMLALGLKIVSYEWSAETVKFRRLRESLR